MQAGNISHAWDIRLVGNPFVAFKIDIARGLIALVLSLGLIALLLCRRTWRRWLIAKRNLGDYCKASLIVGTEEEIAFVADQIRKRPATGYQVVGALVAKSAAGLATNIVTPAGNSINILGSSDDVIQSVVQTRATAVVVAGNVGDRSFLKKLGWDLESTGASLVLASRLTVKAQK